VPVAQRRANAAHEIAKMTKKGGRAVAPVVLKTRKIAATFWGQAWCDNLESYSDYANRLPRGRTYVRNGSVMDLQIGQGGVTSLVSGSKLYRIDIKIKPLARSLWEKIQAECGGKIDSLIELLQGRLSSAVMAIVTHRERGLFPAPKEISMRCSCPDWAGLCKHLAATLYGVGARLDEKPELLFLLRGVDAAELVSTASAAEAVRQTAAPGSPTAIADTELAAVFGIELETKPMAPAAPAPKTSAGRGKPPLTKPKAKRASKKAAGRKTASASPPRKKIHRKAKTTMQ
jgi:uncharacterized Zn finger protein